MDKHDIDAIGRVCSLLEERINSIMEIVMDQYPHVIGTNVLINVATSMLAKALIMADPLAKGGVDDLAFDIVRLKVKEGTARVHSMMTIEKAKKPMGSTSTCQPWEPKKH